MFFPAYVQVFNRIRRERGWSPITRGHFDAMRGPTGAMVIGDPETVAPKIRYVDEALGGVSRVTLQLTAGTLPHEQVLHAIELLGTRVEAALQKTTAEAAGSPIRLGFQVALSPDCAAAAGEPHRNFREPSARIMTWARRDWKEISSHKR